MDEPLAVALKFGFLAVLYLFLLWVARSAMKDLSRYESPSEEPPAPAARKKRDAGSDARRDLQPRLQVIAAMGHEPGTVFDLRGGATMGRADSVDIPVHDPFASSSHARIFARDGLMYIEDMGSTNGTYLNGEQLRAAQRLSQEDTVRIGDSEYRYEE